MAQRSIEVTNWSLTISRLFMGAAVLVGTIYMGRLVTTVDEQGEERRCTFDLATETDRIDSEIQAKQAEIFEAAILRPSTGDGTTEELQRLGNELHALLEDRTVAYEQRDNAQERCD